MLSHLARDNYIHVDEWKKRIGDVTGCYWQKAIPVLAGCLSEKQKFHEFFYFLFIFPKLVGNVLEELICMRTVISEKGGLMSAG
jgi:hypothetical protein